VSDMTFKEMMERLEEITAILEKEDLELEEGLRLFREARERLDVAGSKVEKLIGSMEEGLATEEFQLEVAVEEEE
jgi:exonuclease VII small subunit